MIELTAFLSLGILGIVAATLTKYLKEKLCTNGYLSIAIVIILSIALATLFYVIQDTVWAERIYMILANATIIYNFFIKDQN